MGQFGIGQSVRREEDPRLLRGNGNYVNDMNLPFQTYCYILRSPHAHADITHLNVASAKNAPGVVKIFVGDDVAADNQGFSAPTVGEDNGEGIGDEVGHGVTGDDQGDQEDRDAKRGGKQWAGKVLSASAEAP